MAELEKGTEASFPDGLTAALFQAAASGDAMEVQRLVDAGGDVRYQEETNGLSALMLAAQGNHLDVVNCLLLNGVPWNAVDRRGRSAGDYAVLGSFQEVIDRIVAAGVQSELIFRALGRADRTPAEPSAYLTTTVRYEEGNLLDADNRGVMMEWERPIMEAHAQILCSTGGDVLNIGFGLGLIDSAIQALAPRSHTIVEAHPDVLAKMRADGWFEKPNVRIVSGRWQDALATLGDFDAVYYDAFDDVRGMDEFHEALPALVRPGGLYSFFNGICPESVFSLGVACEVISMELAELGFAIEFQAMQVPKVMDPATWAGTKFRYYLSDTYYLPVAQRLDFEHTDAAAAPDAPPAAPSAE